MAQSSTTIVGQKEFKAKISIILNATIEFSSGDENKIISSINLANLSKFDLIAVTGTANNNKTFTVKSVATDGLSIVVEENVTDETVTGDGSTDTAITYVGFVSDKQKGDGYYSQTDGVHTVSYHVKAGEPAADDNFQGKIKMQASLATTPTESDWFDIDNTTFTHDLSTKVSSYTFTGNFVWVRANIYDHVKSSVTKILYNN